LFGRLFLLLLATLKRRLRAREKGQRARPRIDGVILQAPVSDREAATQHLDSSSSGDGGSAGGPLAEKWYSLLTTTQNFLSDPNQKHRANKVMLDLDLTTPFFGPAPLSIARFHSLASPDSPADPGPDDLFSSDATDEWLDATWGCVGRSRGVLREFSFSRGEEEGDDAEGQAGVKRGGEGRKKRKEILVLVSAEDEGVPDYVDKAGLLGRWRDAVVRGGGGGGAGLKEGETKADLHRASTIIAHGVHDLSGTTPEARHARLVEMRGAVVAYLADVLGEEVDERLADVMQRDAGAGEDEGQGEGGTVVGGRGEAKI
jgi:hypothetical protein